MSFNLHGRSFLSERARLHVDGAARFMQATGQRVRIGSLGDLGMIADGAAGTHDLVRPPSSGRTGKEQ